MTRTLTMLGALALLAAVPAARTVVAEGDGAAALDSKTVARIAEIATSYSKQRKVDEQLRAAPAMCSDVGQSKLRTSDDHGGKKLYYLYAKDRDAYLANEAVSGQWVVKEGFDAYSRANKKELFVMLRTGPGTADSDEGWIYATVDTRGKVTSAGKVASCMACHKLAAHERLFGLDGKKTKKEDSK